MEKIEICKLLRAVIVASASLPSLALAADLPPTLTGTLLNLESDTLTFGSPATTASTALANNSSIFNDGTWNAYAGTISPNYAYTGTTFASSILNSGTLNVDASGGIFRIVEFTTDPSHSPDLRNLTFTNIGTININTGSFYLAAADTGSTSGTINIASGATLGLAGNLTFDQNSTLSGAGNVLLSTDVRSDPNGTYIPNASNTTPAIVFNGIYSVTGTTTIAGTSVTFNHDATLNNLQVTGLWLSDKVPSLAGTATLTLTGAGTVTNPNAPLVDWKGGPVISATSSGPVTVSVKSLIVQGTLKLIGSSGQFTLDGTAITVDPGARLALGVSGAFSTLYFSNNASITNNGTMLANTIIFRTGSAQGLTFTNNGLIQVRNLNMGLGIEFNNNGTVDVTPYSLFQPGPGTDSKTAVVNVMVGARLKPAHSRTFTGTLNNAGSLQFANITLSKDLTFNHTGLLEVIAGNVVLAAPQQPLTTGTFGVDQSFDLRSATLEFATDYDFSSPTGPFLIHNPSGGADGLIIIDPGITLTLPLDTAFAGTIQVDGTLIIAAPLNPANVNMTPNFTIATPTPEPATLGLLALALPLLLRKRQETR